METQIWSKSEEKWAYILVLRGHEVYLLKLTGNMLTLKGKVQRALEALQQGQNPPDIGAKVVENLDAQTISKAQVDPGNSSLTLHGGADGSKNLTYSTGDNDADAILQAILAQSGQTFQPTQEEIGVIEALIPPAFIGVLAGALWAAVYQSAGKIAEGEDVEVKGMRHRGVKQLLLLVAETLGTNGTIAVGVVLIVLIVAWAARRIIHRPERTVWLPQKT